MRKMYKNIKEQFNKKKVEEINQEDYFYIKSQIVHFFYGYTYSLCFNN